MLSLFQGAEAQGKRLRVCENAMLNLRASGLTIPWALVEYPVAIKAMKTALEQGANFWNGVSATF